MQREHFPIKLPSRTGRQPSHRAALVISFRQSAQSCHNLQKNPLLTVWSGSHSIDPVSPFVALSLVATMRSAPAPSQGMFSTPLKKMTEENSAHHRSLQMQDNCNAPSPLNPSPGCQTLAPRGATFKTEQNLSARLLHSESGGNRRRRHWRQRGGNCRCLHSGERGNRRHQNCSQQARPETPGRPHRLARQAAQNRALICFVRLEAIS